MEKMVFCGFVIAWRLATCPTNRSPVLLLQVDLEIDTDLRTMPRATEAITAIFWAKKRYLQRAV
jgi:hypothetical protein